MVKPEKFIAHTIETVCKHFGVSKDILKKEARNRSDRFVEPRQIIIYIICNQINVKDEIIAEIFGHERSNIPYSRSKIKTRMKLYPEFRDMVNELQNRCMIND